MNKINPKCVRRYLADTVLVKRQMSADVKQLMGKQGSLGTDTDKAVATEASQLYNGSEVIKPASTGIAFKNPSFNAFNFR